MTLDEVIKHAEEVAEEKEKNAKFYTISRPDDKHRKSCEQCAEEHRQLAEWLKDYKRLLEQEPKTGHWISVNTGKQIHLKDGRAVESVKCSECDEWLIASDEYDCNGNYCPNCGAKMIEP